uniref:TLC domain containing 4a n=1 Tax=Electrophorus electricus TaxID=8005 RepID=A0AAY5EDJ9_ELEEL
MSLLSRTVSTLHAIIVGLFYILGIGSGPFHFMRRAVERQKLCLDTCSPCSGYVCHFILSCHCLFFTLLFQGQGMLPYFANFRLLAEFSTPCVNQRWFFEVLGYPKCSRPNIANGVLMAVVFFMVRIAVMPVYYSRMYSVYGTEAFYHVSFGGRSAWIFSSFCLDIMNIMWMHKIARGCYKVLHSSRQLKAQTQENGKVD